ncbi:MAG: histidine kinase [Alphaproteobacteria bacterium]|nr:histidine kinase [Alphaproteobacteria bacterium]
MSKLLLLTLPWDKQMGRADDMPIPDPGEPKPTVLIVDDESLIRMSLSDFLQECGFQVIEASTAASAVQILQQGEVKIDFVFSDIRMPGEMDGLGLSRWVKAHRPGLPIVLASADTSKVQIAKELCADEPFFNKPYAMELVAAHIRQVLQTRKAAH